MENKYEVACKRTIFEPTRWDPFEEIRKTQERLYRTVTLPTSVKEEAGTAKMENGVLTITLPKMKLEEPAKKIQIE